MTEAAPQQQEPQVTPLQALFKDFLDFISLRPYYRSLTDHEKAVSLSDKLFVFFQQICQQEAAQAQPAAAPAPSEPPPVQPEVITG